MREQTTVPEDLPFVVRDRRRNPERRATWRGGRRDTDWTDNRPVGYATLTGLTLAGWWAKLFKEQR